jgi:hypothetical protein
MTPIENDPTWFVFIYAVYGLVSVALTIVLARTLFKHGAVFLEDVFQENPGMAESINRLLVVGFYMLNLGYAFLILRVSDPSDLADAVEILVNRLGLLLVSLGLIHFVNLGVFWWLRGRRQVADLPPPVAPQTYVDDPADTPPGSTGRRIAARTADMTWARPGT